VRSPGWITWSGRDSEVERYWVGQGLLVPVQEIARRAGVGTGTVSRQFPTNAALLLFKVCVTDTRAIDAYRATR
jgi:Bacterial regulatory proteins, tetR family